MWNLYITKMSEQMRHLNKKGTHFNQKGQWTPELEEEFVKLKEDIYNTFIRDLFNIDRRVIVYTNASKEGGFAMM